MKKVYRSVIVAAAIASCVAFFSQSAMASTETKGREDCPANVTCVWEGTHWGGVYRYTQPVPQGQCAKMQGGWSAQNNSDITQVLYASTDCTGNRVVLCPHDDGCLSYNEQLPFAVNSIGG